MAMNLFMSFFKIRSFAFLSALFSALFFHGLEAQAEIVIWTSSENVARALKVLTPQFEKAFKEKVEVTVLNKDLTTQFKTAAIAGKGPDILCWANDVIGELASSGLVEPILLDKKLKESFYESALSSFTYRGKLYGYPYDVEAVALIRNKELSPQPKESFEELYRWSKEFDKKEHYPFLFDIKNFYFNYMFLSAGGGYIFHQDKGTLNPLDIGLANDGAINGVRFLKKLTKEEVIPTSSNRNIAFEKMLKGKLAFTIDGPWAIKDLKRANIPFSIDPLPTLNGKTPSPLVGTHGFIIRRSSEKKELAKELIEKYLVTAQALATLYLEDPRGPSRPDTFEILKEKLSPQDLKNLQAFTASAGLGTPMPNISAMGPVWGSMGTALELILQKDKDIKTTLTSAKNRIYNSIRETKQQEKL
jgi:maltose/maltodextrin transport system substrate-binding protein